jgi:hypothetical protein
MTLSPGRGTVERFAGIDHKIVDARENIDEACRALADLILWSVDSPSDLDALEKTRAELLHALAHLRRAPLLMGSR